jgi:CysZ protein
MTHSIAGNKMREAPEGTGLADGVSSFVGGIGFVFVTPSVWPFAAVPILTTTLLACGLSFAGFYGAYQAALSWLGEGDGWTAWGRWAVAISLGMVFMIVALFAALVLARPLAGWALDVISRRQEWKMLGFNRPEASLLRAIAVSLRGFFFALVVSTPLLALLFAIGFFFPPATMVTVPLKFFVVAWLLAWDFLDYPMSLRGMGVRARVSWIGKNFMAYTAFGVAWALLIVLPFLALLVLPFGVAGATRLLVGSERDEPMEAIPHSAR